MPKLQRFAMSDPSYDFEALACQVFDCDRFGDPFRIANAGEYNIPSTSEPPYNFRRALSIVLHKLVFNYPDSSELKALEEKIWEAKSQEDFRDILEETITIYEAL